MQGYALKHALFVLGGRKAQPVPGMSASPVGRGSHIEYGKANLLKLMFTKFNLSLNILFKHPAC